ncbi:MAG: RNA polymerase sigma factor [Agriterribacter sp.]
MNSSENSLADALLLQQIELGSEQAFNLLFETYWEKVYSDAYKRLKDSDDAKDVVQDIFTSIWTNRQSLNIQNLSAYLHIAVRNRAIKILAKKKPVHPFFSKLDSVPEKTFLADADLLWKELFKAYEALLQTLPPKRQIIFKMRYQEGLSTKDIAAQLGIKRKTIQNQLGKAVDALKVSLPRLFILGFAFLLG